MDTVTRGGIDLDSSPRRATSDHHELPIKIAVGGGHKNLAFDKKKLESTTKSNRPCEDVPLLCAVRLLRHLA